MRDTVTKAKQKRQAEPDRPPRRGRDDEAQRRIWDAEDDRFWPLDAPGMPPPGPNFMAHALAQGDDTEFKKTKGVTTYRPGYMLEKLYRRALKRANFTLPITIKKGQPQQLVQFVPGHIWGQYSDEFVEYMSNPDAPPPPSVDGPHPAEIMVIGKMPWTEETKACRNLVGPSGLVLLEMLKKLHFRGMSKWYVTNLVKFMPPTGNTRLAKGWINDCLPLLHEELRIVRPKYILCVGADASKALLGDKYGVGYMEGRVVPYEYQIQTHPDDQPVLHKAQVMTVLHPAEVARDPAKSRILERGLGRFALLTSGVNFDQAEDDIDHRVIDTYEDAVEWVEEVEEYFRGKPLRERMLGWDAEWEGQHPINKGSYLRCLQCAWAPKHSVCFKLTHAGGKPAFVDADGKPAQKRLAKLLTRFARGKRAVGHFFVSDLEWFEYYGFHVVEDAEIPLDPIEDYIMRNGRRQRVELLAWERLRRGEGWLDTAMMVHAIEETAPLGLESVGMRYTTAPRWDVKLEEWKKNRCKELGIPATALEGYGNCPDEILFPYANYDADVTLRAALELLPYLDEDYEGNNSWEAFWESMIAQPVTLEMHINGIKVDRKRIDVLTEAFYEARAATEEQIQKWARWDVDDPEAGLAPFNIRSVQQVKEFLFGTKYNGKINESTGQNVRIRPPDAKSLHLTPLLDTSKPPRRWEDIVAAGKENEASPGTGKMILAILAQDNLEKAEQINWVRDYRFLDQVLKGLLRPPSEDGDENWIVGDDGLYEYEAGLASCIDDDGRVRTHLYTTAETGRWKSSRPNLQNISKQRDPDYVRLLGGHQDASGNWVGGNYVYKLRSLLMASPGYALVEFDYKGAELYGMAIMSGDELMIEHSQRALYPDEGYDENGNEVKGGKYPHPKYYDIHSNVACLAFRLDCAPTKQGLKSIGKAHFRILAKNVIFGIAYGRGAKAIALQAKENKKKGDPEITVEDAQAVIDAIFEMYPKLQPFFDAAKSRAIEEKHLCNCFGRRRRFPTAMDYKLEGEFERQAMNFPIQSMVASCVNRGLARLRKTIRDLGLKEDIKLLLQIHDAGLIECRYYLLEYVVDELLPYCMQDCVPIFPSHLDGSPLGTGPYRLGIDVSVENHWGERYTKEECERYDIPIRFAA